MRKKRENNISLKYQKILFLLICGLILLIPLIAAPEQEEGERVIIEAAENSQLRKEIIKRVGAEYVEHPGGIEFRVSKTEKEKIKADSFIIQNAEVIEGIPISAVLQDSVGIINADDSWGLLVDELNLTGTGQTVCVLDTGMKLDHPDLSSKYLGGYDYVNEDGNPTDDNGHGTHVAGIVAANNSINGVAKGADLVIVKVLDAGGNGGSVNLNQGIEWCLDNRETYNISVITMSLAVDCDDYPEYCYDDYCDALDGDTTSLINQAVGNGTIVFGASGNDGNTTHIPWPACIKNMTAIAATDKSDNMASYSNRNNLVNLVATGSNINSTKYTGGYEIKSGTSMATPHTAGAAAIIKQVLEQTSQVLTPAEIMELLNETGEQIYDAGSGLNFSRINVYSAILSLDNIVPDVGLVSPNGTTVNLSDSQIFSCNGSDWQLSNATIYLWNSSGDVVNNTNINDMAGTENSTNFTLTLENTLPGPGAYYWNCLVSDEESNHDFGEDNFTITIQDDVYPSVVLDSPENNSESINLTQRFTCNVSDYIQLSNATLYVWNSSNDIINSSETNNVTGTSNQTSFTIQLPRKDTYYWNCLVYDNESHSGFADENFTLNIESISMNLTSPENNSYSNQDPVNFTCQAESIETYSLTNITFYLWNSSNDLVYNQTEDISGSLNQTVFNYTLVEDTYHWNCLGFNNNSDNSLAVNNLTITYDNTNPNITLISPADSAEYTSDSQEITFSYNVSDDHDVNCSLIVNDIIESTNSSINQSITQSFSDTFTPGDYNWKISCTDLAGNEANSSERSFSVEEDDGGGGGGGGGGGSAITHKPTEEQANKGYNGALKAKDKIEFKDKSSQKHTLTVNSFSSSSAQITVQSEPVTLILSTGEEKKINLTSSAYYELYVKYHGMTNNRANITLKTIYELIPESEKNISDVGGLAGGANETEPRGIPVKAVNEIDEENKTNFAGNVVSEPTSIGRKGILIYSGVIILIIVIIFIIIRYFLRYSKKKKK
jgi:subtilisin family serine protease